jgi:hypothetical protein
MLRERERGDGGEPARQNFFPAASLSPLWLLLLPSGAAEPVLIAAGRVDAP